MSQHFLLSSAARTLSLSDVMRLTDAEAEDRFQRIRWAATDGKPVCPHCDCPTVYTARRPNGASRFRCKACRKDFSVTSGTLFAFHKLPLQVYLSAIAIFCNVNEDLRDELDTRKLRGKFWVSDFADLIIDRTWDNLK